MEHNYFSTAGHTVALDYAVKELRTAGWVRDSNAPILLLPVPSFEADGSIQGGGHIAQLPADKLIVGGNLDHPALNGHRCLDLLKHPLYLSENAAITAHCAVRIIMENLPVTLQDCPILVAGWGRIGKCLVRLLRFLGAKVTVAARSEADRALAEVLGYRVMDIQEKEPDLSGFRAIINTVPAMVFPAEKMINCGKCCLLVDLASKKGIESPDVIWARGLPNLDAPESSGKLIAKVIRKELET